MVLAFSTSFFTEYLRTAEELHLLCFHFVDGVQILLSSIFSFLYSSHFGPHVQRVKIYLRSKCAAHDASTPSMLIFRFLKSPPRSPHLRNHNHVCHAIILKKSFTSAAQLRAKALPPRRKIEEDELEEKFIRGCGPGGQKIVRSTHFFLLCLFFNPVSPSLIVLHTQHHCLNSFLPSLPSHSAPLHRPSQKTPKTNSFGPPFSPRLRSKQNKTSSAVHLRHVPSGIQIKTQVSRSQALNRKFARRLLADKVEQMEKGSESRVEMKAEIKRKKKASRMKKTRRKYANLREGEIAKNMREMEGGEENEEEENEVREEEGKEEYGMKGNKKERRRQDKIEGKN